MLHRFFRKIKENVWVLAGSFSPEVRAILENFYISPKSN
jgi:hypothetical protein